MKNKRAIIALLFVSLLAGFIGCGKPSANRQSSGSSDSSFWARSWNPSSSTEAGGQPFQSQGGQNIALLLPFKGAHAKAAYAILDGFLAAYYQDTQGQFPGAAIRVYDTSLASASSLYQKAASDGASFVVGPLTKKEVQAVAGLRHLPVPTLALNSISNSRSSEQFFQFALSPEEETEALAERVFKAGHKRALILVPKSDWGKRMNAAFSKAWHQEGGVIAETYWAEAGPGLSEEIKTFLQVNDRRARELGKVRTGALKSSDPRRRHDFDVIILATSTELARQIRPLLNFYYAGHLPIYGSSSIYSGIPDISKDLDLNGVIFSDMPGILDKRYMTAEVNQAWHSLWPNQPASSIRLFMMGMDAYQLIQSLPNLRNGSNSFTGRSGILSLDEQGHLHRKLIWAQIRHGQAELIHEDPEQPR